MGHWGRVVLVFKGLALIILFIVLLTRVAGPLFVVAENQTIANSSSVFHPAYAFIKQASYWLLVPLFTLGYFAYLVIGPAQDELQKEKKRRGL